METSFMETSFMRIFKSKTFKYVIYSCLIGIFLSAIYNSYKKTQDILKLEETVLILEDELDGYRKQHQNKEETLNNLVDEVNKYIYSVAKNTKLSGKHVVDACLKHDIDIIFVLAQGELESCFGIAGIAKKTNSVWNVGSFDGRSSEYIIKSNLGYSHPNYSIEPYITLIKTKYLSKNKTEKDLMRNFVSNSGHRYASSKTYEQNLSKIYRKINKNTNILQYYNDYKTLYI